MNNRALGFIAAGAALGLGTMAMAQSGGSPFTVRAGVVWPTNSTIKDAVSKTGLMINASYDLPRFGGMTTGTPSVDVDYTTVTGNGFHFTSWGVLLAARFSMMKSETMGTTSFAPYIGFGVGYYHHDIGGGGGTTTKKDLVGGKIMLGANFSQRFSLEAFYRISGSVQGLSTDVFGILAGVRF